jgi:hypothetical protein
MSKTREVKADRIKPLRFQGKFTYVRGNKPTEDEIRARAASAIAEEFTRKLLQFNKIEIWEEGYSIHFKGYLEVIVPDTPTKKTKTKKRA